MWRDVVVLNTWLNFVNVDGSSRTRRRAPLGDLNSVAREIVDVFETFQLLTINQDERGDTVVDVKQETVLRAWPRLVDHITEHAAVLSERAQLEPLAHKWHESGRDDTYLVLKADQARRALQHDLLRSGLLGDFLRASVDIDPADQISKNAAAEAMRTVPRDPEEAIRIAQAAVELKPTTDARFALYRTWASGLRAVFRTPDCEPTSVAWSADGRLAWGSDDGRVRIRSADGQTRVMPGHTKSVRTLAWSADGRLASGSDDTTIRLWSSDGLKSDVLAGHAGPVTAVDWSVDGRLASGSADATVRIWTSSGQVQDELTDHQGVVTSVAWSFDGRLASASVDTRVRVWGTDMTMQVLNGHTQPVRSVAWSLDGKLASGGDDRKVRVSANGQLEYVLTGHGDGVRTVGWTRDGRLVTGCADKSIRVWGGKQLLHTFDGHDGAVVSVAWAPDGRFASASTDKTVRIWGRTQELVQSLSGHAGTVVSVAWSPDGRLASGSTDKSVRVWAADGQLQEPYLVYPNGRRSEPPVAWSADRRLAFGGGFTDPRMRVPRAERGSQRVKAERGQRRGVAGVVAPAPGLWARRGVGLARHRLEQWRRAVTSHQRREAEGLEGPHGPSGLGRVVARRVARLGLRRPHRPTLASRRGHARPAGSRGFGQDPWHGRRVAISRPARTIQPSGLGTGWPAHSCSHRP